MNEAAFASGIRVLFLVIVSVASLFGLIAGFVFLVTLSLDQVKGMIVFVAKIYRGQDHDLLEGCCGCANSEDDSRQ